MSVPRKLGLVTTHALANRLIILITKFYDKMQQYLTSEEFAKIVDLLECCRAVVSDVPQYPTE